MSAKTWRPQLLHLKIIEVLERRGSLTDAELYNLLKEFYEDLSFSELNKALMDMEITGHVHVSTLTKGRKRIELVRKETR